MRLRAILALAVTALGMFLFGPATHATAYPPTTCASLSVSTTNPQPGEQITLSSSGMPANATVKIFLHSDPILLATVHTDATGSFTATVTLPDGITGTHTIVAVPNKPMPAGCPPPSVTITVQGPGTNPGGTSFTGVDVLAMVLGALALLGVGVALNRGGRRRKVTYQGEM
jgi:5'-nucleotidase